MFETNKQNREANQAEYRELEKLRHKKSKIYQNAELSEDEMATEADKMDRDIEDLLKNGGGDTSDVIKEIVNTVQEPKQDAEQSTCEIEMKKQWSSVEDTLKDLLIQPCQVAELSGVELEIEQCWWMGVEGGRA